MHYDRETFNVLYLLEMFDFDLLFRNRILWQTSIAGGKDKKKQVSRSWPFLIQFFMKTSDGRLFWDLLIWLFAFSSDTFPRFILRASGLSWTPTFGRRNESNETKAQKLISQKPQGNPMPSSQLCSRRQMTVTQRSGEDTSLLPLQWVDGFRSQWLTCVRRHCPLPGLAYQNHAGGRQDPLSSPNPIAGTASTTDTTLCLTR